MPRSPHERSYADDKKRLLEKDFVFYRSLVEFERTVDGIDCDSTRADAAVQLNLLP